MIEGPTTAVGPFLGEVGFSPLADGLIARARFDPEAYEPGLFDALAVPCPDTVRQARLKRQVDYLAGRLVARHAIHRFGGTVSDLPVGQDRGPIWPVGINGSISHAGQTSVVLVTRQDQLCGIDCEVILHGSALDAVYSQCLSARERDWTDRQSVCSAAVAATLLFSAKEAIFKALARRVGRFFGFDAAEVLDWADADCLKVRLTQTLHPDAPEGLVLHVQSKIIGNLVLTWIVMPDPSAP